MSRCFISYRRDDSADVTGRLSDRLKSRFGSDAVFLDIDGIPLGVDFRRSLAGELDHCDVLLAVIGDYWLNASYQDGPKQGTRRLDDPDDYVRIEIETALARDIPIVPLLVGRTTMPRESDLPDSMRALAYRNAAALRSGPDFESQVDRLIHSLKQLLATKRKLWEGLAKATRIADEDPAMGIARARVVLELLVRDLYERSFHEPPATRSLEHLVERLDNEGLIPDRFDVPGVLRQFTENRSIKRGEMLTVSDVHKSLTQLTEILKWYIDVEQPKGMGQHSRSRKKSDPHAMDREARMTVVPKGLRSFDSGDAQFFLELLPGPRDEAGLPESLRFWKHRIESSDELLFTIGVIYGPSGCGKSSLVKAGLLPRLAPEIVSVYVESSAEDTESHLLTRLRRRQSGVATDLDLAQTLRALRQVQGLAAGERVLIILDQFEQWLHAHRGESDTTLARALRQCDGDRLRCLLIVRDDFWMGLTRFLRDLGVEMVQGENVAAVDLFDPIHARRVLTAFGQAFTRLPSDLEALAPEQQAFLDQAIEWLAQDGRVISVRLALFAEMVKRKPWTPTTLADAGSMERIGAAFLEETFRSASLRAHQKAAQAVLKALLPERGTDIKGHMRSFHELRMAPSAALSPEAFASLLKTLDREVRLITPADPEGAEVGAEEARPPVAPEGQYYQLTHDYLVPSLREWLNSKLRETRRGRAEIRLAERAALWRDRPERRFLPSAWEWYRIRVLTEKRNWTEPQRQMMRTAARVHGMRVLGFTLLIALLLWVGIEGYGNLRAAALVDSVRRDPTSDVPALVPQLVRYRRWAEERLTRLARESAPESRERLNASLALLAEDAGQVDYLYARMLNAGPADLGVIRDWIKQCRKSDKLTPRLWGVLNDPRTDRAHRFAAACALASYDPRGVSGAWEAAAGFIGDRLLASVLNDPGQYMPLIALLRPVREHLLPRLEAIFRDKDRAESDRTMATVILCDYAGDRPSVLADLLMDADEKPFAALFARLKEHPNAGSLLHAELAKKSASTDDTLARRQARAAVALIRLGEAEKIWPLLKNSSDPTLRSFIVNWLNPLGAEAAGLAEELARLDNQAQPGPAKPEHLMDAILFHSETSIRRSLILALGTYRNDQLTSREREQLIERLLDLYQSDVDSGIHRASAWTLRTWRQQKKLDAMDRELITLRNWGDRRWFINKENQTFAMVLGPNSFLMGSPETEPGRRDYEAQHHVLIPRSYAICTKEISIDDCKKFLAEYRDTYLNDSMTNGAIDSFSPEPGGPMFDFTWFSAAAYCNWLSKREGLPREQWCYEPDENGKFAERMTIPADVLRRTGYRMPTQAEWEFACRSGSLTSRYYGASEELLQNYAWYQNVSKDRARSRGSLLPNDFGLFDTLGNLAEWVLDREPDNIPKIMSRYDDLWTSSEVVSASRNRRHLGGAFYYRTDNVRASYSGSNIPSYKNTDTGLRVARTLP